MGDTIYNGFWINWEHGKFEGATLTLPTYNGLILVSFLTLFVQFSGGCLWRVLCFALHQFRSSTVPRDGLYHQQQVILRNATTAPNALYNICRTIHAWRFKVYSPLRQSLPLLSITTFHIVFFAAAGLLSSQIASTTTGQGLVRSTICGFPKEVQNVHSIDTSLLTADDLLTFNAEILLGRLTLTKSASYVRSCYNDNSNSADCNTFIQPYLAGDEASTVNNATCPFGGNACVTNATVRYDSGHIRSNEHLGMNLPIAESMSMRRVTQCAPIRTEDYATPWRANLPEAIGGKTNTSLKFYEFGKGGIGCHATSQDAATPLTTFCISQYQKDYIDRAYTLSASTAYHANDTASDFAPIADFQVPNADVTLIAIFNKAEYTSKSSDPLFNAQNASDRNSGFASPTYDLSVLACTEQYQFCNVQSGVCTELTGLYGVKTAVDNGTLGLSAHQQATYNVMWKSAWTMALQWACRILSDNILLAQDWVFTEQSTSSSPLPSNQWELESHNMHNLSLAVFQRRINEYSSPVNWNIRPGLNSHDQIDKPTDPSMQYICRQQRVHSSDHYSVSVVGMAVILLVGSFFVLLDWVLVQQIFWFRSTTHMRLAKKAEWQSTGTLQLHREALEGKGISGWNTSADYQFPSLRERGRLFTGLGVKDELPMGAVGGQMGSAGHTHNGGSYAALAHDAGAYDNIHVRDLKGVDGRA